MVGKIVMNERDADFRPVDPFALSSRWLVATGVALAVLGTLALTMSVATTLISVVVIGAMFLASAVFQAFFAGSSGRWTGFGWHLISAALYGVAGLFLILDPGVGARSLTLLLAFFFVASGGLRSASAVAARLPRWRWTFFGGLVTIALGVYIVMNLPAASLVTLGVVLGVDLVFLGVHLAVAGSRTAALGRAFGIE